MTSNISSPLEPTKHPTPAELARALDRIVAEETGCPVSWAQHPHPVTAGELRRIALKICTFLWDIRAQQ